LFVLLDYPRAERETARSLVFARFDRLQDRISPLLVNNSFKRRLTGGAFEQLFRPKGREFEQANLQKFKCPGDCLGGDVEASI